jgi:hypothetical protein
MRVPRLVAVLICLATVAGCSRQWRYDKPGVAGAQRSLDEEECRKANTVPRVSRPVVISRGRLESYPFENLDRHGYDLCMEGKGYTVTRE